MFAKLGYCKKGRGCRNLHFQENQQANLQAAHSAAHAGVKNMSAPDIESTKATTQNKQPTGEIRSMATRDFCRFEESRDAEDLVVGKGTPFDGFLDQSDFISLE